MIDQDALNKWTVNPVLLKRENEQLREDYDHLARLCAQKVEQVEQELSDSTNHYNGIINGLRAEVEKLRKGWNESHDEVQQLKAELHDAKLEKGIILAQKYPAVSSAPIPIFGQLDGQAPKLIRPEPSRLEIAVLLASGLNPCWNFSVEALFCRVDAIIAKAKEVAK